MQSPRTQNYTIEEVLQEARQSYINKNPLSKRNYETACRFMPGGNTRTVLFYEPFPLTLVRGEGACLWDADGHIYTDFVGEFSAGLYGHSDSRIQAAIEGALSNGIVLGGPNSYEDRLAKAICDRFPSIDLVRFVNSGTEANILAIATARAVTQRSKILAFRGGYHGGVLSFAHEEAPINVPFSTVMAKYNDIENTLDLLYQEAHDLAAVIVEPMMGAAGCIPAEQDFLHSLRDATQKHGIILIFDEVMTSRLAPGGLQEAYDIHPDLTTLGKYVGGGLSFGAFGGRSELMSRYDPRQPHAFPHAGTFNNDVCTMAAGMVGLTEIFTPEAALMLSQEGDQLRTRLNEVATGHGSPMQATGVGSLINIHFCTNRITSPEDLADSDLRARELWHYDLLARGKYVQRRGYMSLSLAMKDEDLDGLVTAMEEFLDARAPLLQRS